LSAGNDGAAGLFLSGSAADGKGVTSIAAIDNIEAPMVLLNATYDTNDTQTEAFGWVKGDPSYWGNVSLSLWAVNYNTSDPANGCEPYPDDTPNLTASLVLIRRGNCTFDTKATYAIQKGARYIMFYNDVAG
jgi:hypothetical protein